MTTYFEWREAPESHFAVLGDPIEHSWSPKMQAAAMAALGLTYRYVAIRVPLDEFEQALARLAALGYLGLNATVPLKEAAFAWCRTTDEPTKRYKAVNTLRPATREGTNTDAPGFLSTLREFGIAPGSSVIVLGAGGTARTLVPALDQAGYRVAVWNRTASKAAALAEGTGAEVLARPILEGRDLIVNATSAGLAGENLALDWQSAAPNALAYDLLYAAEPTSFLHAAQGAGLRTADGRDLLVAQGAISLEWWLGVTAPRNVMREALS